MAVLGCDGDGGPAGGADASAPGADGAQADTTAGDAAPGDSAAGDATGDGGPGDAGDVESDVAADATADATPAEPTERAGCDGSTLYTLPSDYAARGPWPVGARTIEVAGLTTEVWYPAPRGSEVGQDPVVYDVREHLPEAEQQKIPDEVAPMQPCDCTRDLALDTEHGPYPVVVFVHGTASFRTQSLTQMVHWASRGFVVLSSDHPGLRLADVLQMNFNAKLPDDTTALLDALAAPEGDLAFLAGHLAQDRIGLAGHSAGGGGIKGFGGRPGVRVLIPMAAGGAEPGDELESTLVMGGLEDGIVPFSQQEKGYADSPVARRLVGLEKAGHLAFSDLCAIARDEGGLLDLALKHGVTVPQPDLFAVLAKDGCNEGQLSPEEGWQAVNEATAAVLEETLQCDEAAAAALATLKDRHPAVTVYEQTLE
jgi:hypothetical protein